MKTMLVASSTLVQKFCLASSVQLKTVLKSKLPPCKRQIIQPMLQHPRSTACGFSSENANEDQQMQRQL